MFLHGSWYHLLSNMWFLMIFGDNIEDRLGSFRYLLFYVLGGLSAALLQFVFDPASTVPTLGASGAIAAVMGAYFVLFPASRVVTFIPISSLADSSACQPLYTWGSGSSCRSSPVSLLL
jgi:membrane associated rhomboid family serine protease